MDTGPTRPLLAAFVTGLASYVFLFNRPMRGDIWLACQVLAAIIIFSAHLAFYRHSWGSSFYFAASVMFCHITSLVSAAVIYRLSPFHPLAKFPGPILNRITSLKLVFMVASGRRYTVIAQMHQKYGPFVRTGPNTLSINSHAAVSPIYAAASAWNKSAAYSLGQLPGAGLFFIQDKEIHNFRRRHFWAPAFTANMIECHTSILDRRTNTLLDVLDDHRQVKHRAIDMSTALQHWAHDVTGELTFGEAYRGNLLTDGDSRDLVYAALLEAQTFEALGEAPSLFEVLWHLPTTKIFRVMDDMAGESLHLHRKMGAQGTDLISALLSEKPSEVPPLSDEDLRQEAILAIQAGTNGISTALTFAFFYLACNPKSQNRLKTELQSAFPHSHGDDTLETQLLGELPYLNAVVEECLRLGAPLGSFPRVTPKGGATVAGEYIPESTIVGVPAWAQMISEENFYPDPARFLPERWLPGGLGPGSHVNKAALMTFSHGPFGCLGKPLAYQEMRVVISKMLLRYNIMLPPDFDAARFLDGVKNMRVTTFANPLRLVLT